MNIHLHQQVRTSPHLNRHTVAKWRQRKGTEDGPQRLRTTLSAAQETVVVALLPLDNLLAVIHAEVSRSGLDCCLRRHRVSNLKALMPQEEGAKTPATPFKAYAPRFRARRCQVPSPNAG